MMLRVRYKSSDEAIDSIIERPVEAFLSIKIDGQLLERMNENADDIMESILDIGDEVASLGVYLLICLLHIGEIIFFPIVKVVRFRILRKDIIRREEHYRTVLRDVCYTEKPTK